MLTAIQRLQMAAQVSELMDQQREAKAMERISIAIQINDLMTQLGYGQNPTNSGDRSTEHEPDPAPVIHEETPQMVADFLSGKYDNADQSSFVSVLRGLKDYVGEFLTFDQAKEVSQKWLNNSGYQVIA